MFQVGLEDMWSLADELISLYPENEIVWTFRLHLLCKSPNHSGERAQKEKMIFEEKSETKAVFSENHKKRILHIFKL